MFAVVKLPGFAAMRKRATYRAIDATLQRIAETICALLPQCSIARTGRISLEFTFRPQDQVRANALLGELCATLGKPFAFEDFRSNLMPVIGATWINGRPISEHVFDEAMAALEHASENRSRAIIYDRSLAERDVYERVALMRDLSRAIVNDELALHYQPKLSARTATINSAEALLRWDHPEHGLLRTDRLIHIAEQTGAVRELTEWVVRRSLRDAGGLEQAGFEHRVFVNISGLLLSDADFAAWLLETSRGSEYLLGLEITETAVIGDPEIAIEHLEAFVAAGIAVAIDDYGSGLSSLAYLKRLPACELKIDQSFISKLTASHRDPLLVRSTIDLAHALEMDVTAEGVEDNMTLSLLQIMGCDIIQGFVISTPLPIEDYAEFLGNFDGEAIGSASGAPTLLGTSNG